MLRQAFPGHAVYGEEHGRDGGDGSGLLWLVDPIDGTKSFVRGNPMFSTQIALMHGSALVLGVSSAPAADEVFYARRGGGAWPQMVELAEQALHWVKQHGRDGWAAFRPSGRSDVGSSRARTERSRESGCTTQRWSPSPVAETLPPLAAQIRAHYDRLAASLAEDDIAVPAFSSCE